MLIQRWWQLISLIKHGHGDLIQSVFLIGFDLQECVYSWVTRFVNNCRVNKEHRLSGELTIEEIKDSEKTLIKKAQQVAFKEEYLALNNGKPLSTSSKLLGL